jgi:hypothetical protein
MATSIPIRLDHPTEARAAHSGRPPHRHVNARADGDGRSICTGYAITLPNRSAADGDTWTYARLSLVVALWIGGHSAQQIVDRLEGGASRSSVIRQLHRLGFVGRSAWRRVLRRSGPWKIWSGAHNRARARKAAR